MGLGRKIEKGFSKADKFVNKVGRKAEGALESVNKLATKAESKVEKTINRADQVLDKGVESVNKGIQRAGKVGSKAIDVGYNISKKIDRGLDAAARSGAGDIAGVGEVLTAARGMSEGVKRGLEKADKFNEKVKKAKLEKDSLRKKAIELAKGEGVNKTFV